MLAGAAFASSVGLSVYVAFGFVLLMLAWLVRLGVQRHTERVRLWQQTAAATAIATVLLFPLLFEFASGRYQATAASAAADPTAGGAHLFSLSVRRMIDSGMLTGLPVFASWNAVHPVLVDQAIRLFLLLPGLAMELGVYGAVLVLLLLARRRREPALSAEPRATALFFTVCGLLMSMFLSSSVISNNDFGYRAVMLPQFFLLLLTADVLGSWWTAGITPVIAPTPARRRFVYGLLALGIAGSLYGAFLLRAWLPLEEPRTRLGFAQMAEDNFAIREAFAALDHVAPKDAVISFRPIEPVADRMDEVMTPAEFYQRMLVMDAGRQILNAEGKCAVHFGGDPAPCAAIQKATAQLYSLPTPSADQARAYCSQFGVQYLVVGHRDPVWPGSSSRPGPAAWPSVLPEAAGAPGFRILRCGP
jgi:hypothetical protein